MGPLESSAVRISQRSIIADALGQLRPFGVRIDDGASVLQSTPLGMFFYNQRALFFLFGFVYLITLQGITILDRDRNMQRVVWLLSSFWTVSVALTMLLHGAFLKRLRTASSKDRSVDFPPHFYPYFILDACIVLALIGAGHVLDVDLHYFAFLLLANAIVYCVCAGTLVSTSFVRLSIPLLLCLFSLIVFNDLSGKPFYTVVNLGPIVGTATVAVTSVLIVSSLRQRDHRATLKQLEFLGRAEEILSGVGRDATDGRSSGRHPRAEYDHRLRRIFRALATENAPLWYDAARLWLCEERDDHVNVLMPGPFHNLHDTPQLRRGVPIPNGIVHEIEFVRLPFTGDEQLHAEIFTEGLAGASAAAIVPIRQHNRDIGLMVLYGKTDALPPTRLETTFLKSLASIIGDNYEQWESRHQSFPKDEIDDLFRQKKLDDVYRIAARIMARYMDAAGCVIFAKTGGSTAGARMAVRAAEGFARSIFRRYRVEPESFVMDWAQHGHARRWARDDSVEANGDLAGHMNVLERYHHGSIASALLLPLRSGDHAVGLVELIDARGRVPWFTRRDEVLACRLADTLYQLTEKFYRIETMADLLDQKEKAAAEANLARDHARRVAHQRQDDIMVITHQLQAPLVSIRAGISMVRKSIANPDVAEKLDHIHALVTDSLALCYGTVTTFAQEAGRRTSFGVTDIDAPTELERLARRLQRTNAREDIEFEFKSVSDFPLIKMDRNVFTSVLFSLVHNAMKYAARNSRVTLECSYERATGEAALKVKSIGEPIRPDEKELIFEKYGRGKVIAATGRHHGGVGLGLWVARQLMRAVGGDLMVELSEEYPELSVFVVLCKRNL